MAHSVDGGDVLFLYRDFGIYAVNIFDIKVAANILKFNKQCLAAL
jgi:ribonuclease D